MQPIKNIGQKVSVIYKYQYKWVLIIALSWTIIDLSIWLRFMNRPIEHRGVTIYQFLTPGSVLLRAFIDFLMGLFMGEILIFRLRRMFIHYPLLLTFCLKTIFLIIAAFFMNFLVHMTYSLFILDHSFLQSLLNFQIDAIHRSWMLDQMTNWILIFLFTQLIIELNEKYSPGVFADILLGKYIKPKTERRIVMFMDLKDSTPNAVKLGHNLYFRFIRDFIAHLSMSLLEFDGRIYQYVGDEIVVSWKYTQENALKCIRSIIAARRAIQKNSEGFLSRYGIVPEFRVGIHCGDVTVGEVGIIKKDLAMSGDTMNTVARIKEACSDLNQNFVASKSYMQSIDLKDWQYEYLGEIDLKGKSEGISLYALKI